MAKILIVDDLPANRAVLAVLVTQLRHTVLEAADGAAGLAIARSERPDLVITDVLMPVMDGFELVQHLRADAATAAIPVVFYTAHYGEGEARELARSMGVAHVLTKPVDPEAVRQTITAVLAGRGGDVATSPRPLDEYDREHLRLLTDKLSTTAEGLRRADAVLRALINIGLELATQKDPGKLLGAVGVAAHDLFAASYASVGILDPGDSTLRHVVASGVADSGWIRPGDRVSGIFETVVRDRKTMLGHNPGGDPTRLGLPASHPRMQSYLIAPIASPARVYGWLCLVSNEGTSFTATDEPLAMALAGQVGRTYENMYFHSIAERRATALEHEVTVRKQAEAAARVERDRAQRYLDTADVILLALDVDRRITLINRKGCDLLGWSEDELLGRDWVETCLPPAIRTRMNARFTDLLGGDFAIIENPILTRSGDERLIEWRNRLLRDDEGRVTGVFTSGTDITERSAAVAALRAAEERMRFALESADVGIWDMDYRTGVLTWSETLERHYGFAPGTFPGTFDAFIDRIHPDDREQVLGTLGAAMAAGADFTVENRTVPVGGVVRHLRGAGRILLDSAGTLVRGIGISIDLTDRVRLEQQFQQAQKMEAVGRLAGGIAHDFNNLLTAILGYCELLLTDLTPEDPRRADVAEIQNAGTSAAALTRQLLAFSRKQIIEPTVLNLNDVIANMRAMIVRLIGEDIDVVLSLPADLGLVTADRGQAEQVIMNLAVNARDAMPGGGKLTIETANVELDEHYASTHLTAKPGPYVALTITDTGTGMSPAVQMRLFEPFFTTKEPGKGTGLGLATVHGIVTGHGGHVEVYSELGTGTAFKVYLPRVEETEAAVDVRAPVNAPTVTGETVLLVEDADGLRELTRRLLTREGYTVLVAANADQATSLFERHPEIDVILTDVVMPGTSGPDLTRPLVEKRPGLKVIYMSGYTEEAIVHHGVLNPGIQFLHKPFTSESLARKLRDALGR